jgi:hypothetical protein
MTDPTLAALLSDPDSAARLIAADWLQQRSRDSEAAWQLWIYLTASGPVGIRAEIGPRRKRWEILLYGPDEIGGEVCCIWRGAPGRGTVYRRPLRVLDWEVVWPHGSGHAPATPPPGLDAAVLAVLRRRLAELAR